MFNTQQFITAGKKHAHIGVLFALVVGLILIGERLPEAAAPAPATTPPAVQSASEVDGIPKTLRIPKLDLVASFGPTLGLKSNQEIQVPSNFSEVGWYQFSPVPGALGPAVVLGHVDSYEGPAVFYSLGQLQVGDEIIVERTDGVAVTFEVTASERYEQNSFPTELVYGDLDYAGLRLVTCSGWYDRTTDRYSHNRVVFARLKSG